MFDLNTTTGEITIDFEVPDPDPSATQVVKVVVAPPPTVGAYKRLRGEVDKINRGRDQLASELEVDEKVGAAEMTSRLNGYLEDGLLEWWQFVMVGDDTYRGQASPPPPADRDGWPLYLVSNDAMQQALAHWKTVPLARGGQLVQR